MVISVQGCCIVCGVTTRRRVWAKGQGSLSLLPLLALLYSFSNASVNSTCAQPRPPPRADPRALAFFLAQDGKFPEVGTLELSNAPGGDEKKGKKPRPPSTLQHFSLTAQSNSAILSILMRDFLLQLTSALVIAQAV